MRHPVKLTVIQTLILLALSASHSHAEVYRWQDAQGRVHFGDRPPATVQAHSLDTPKHISWYPVRYIPDGDTIHLRNGEKIRLIGINTPEVAHRGNPGQPGGIAAMEFLRKRLDATRVRLETGVERRDRYDRLLAHVYTEDDTNINALMLRKGLAHVVVKPPNLKHTREYFQIEAAARKQGIGIWALPDYQIFEAGTELLQRRNQFTRVQGRISRSHKHKRYTSLWMGNGFRIRIDKQAEQYFEQAGIKLASLSGKTLIVRGWIKQFRGKPSMWLEHPLSVESGL